MSIPNVGEWVGTMLDGAAKAYLVQRRTKRGGEAFLWVDDLQEKPLVLPASECEPIATTTTEIEWANMAIAEATDEIAVEMYWIFQEAYSTPEDWRREIWAGLTPENREKIRRFKAIALAQAEVAA